MFDSIVQPKRPRNISAWDILPGGVGPLAAMGYPYQRWMHKKLGIRVISAVEVATDTPGQPSTKGPEYHLSATIHFAGRLGRVPAELIPWLLKEFDIEGAEEDNHVNAGIARNFWKPVAERLVGIECACKEDEPLVIEGDYEYRPLKMDEESPR